MSPTPTPHTNATLESPLDNFNCAKATIFFRDGIRSVDFVLVWDSFQDEAKSQQAVKKRALFELNLVKEGLELEYEPPETNGLCFIKVR